MHTPLTSDQINQLRAFNTCIISDAIETFGVRLRNEGFATAGFRCLFKNSSAHGGLCGHLQSSFSQIRPIVGSRYDERTDWWKHIASIPAPRVVVMQDIDDPTRHRSLPGQGSRQHPEGLGCVGASNQRSRAGIARNRSQRTSRFLRDVLPSPAPIFTWWNLAGRWRWADLRIQPGDLIHGDRHGIITVPQDLASSLPAVARGSPRRNSK